MNERLRKKEGEKAYFRHRSAKWVVLLGVHIDRNHQRRASTMILVMIIGDNNNNLDEN